MSKRVTLKEVATHAGVSYQTVSKVLNKQAQVSKQTEERIWESVRSLGYRPNLIARSLRSMRSRLIGYAWEPVPPDQTNPILDRFLQSMAQEAASAGYHLLAFPYRPGVGWIESYRELIDTNRVDAFVISSVDFNDPRITFLQERSFPFVAFGRSNPDWEFPYVDIDGAAGLRMVVEHLLALGHRRIFTLAWPLESRVGQNRIEGFLSTLAEADICPPPGWIARGEGDYTFGFEATTSWMNLPEDQRPTAIVALSDIMAIGAMHAVQQSGLRVGADVAITGFDDTPLIQYLTPSLTSVRQPIWEVGQRVIRMLLSIMEAGEPEQMHALLAPRLIVRNSTAREQQWIHAGP